MIVKEKLIEKFISGKTVLDIGCANYGNPFMYDFIKRTAKSVEGIDNDRKTVEALVKKGYNIKVADAQNFTLGKKFDVILCADIVEHLSCFSGFFNSCKKHLNRDGTLLIFTPNAYAFNGFATILFKGKYKIHEEHTCIFDESTIKELLSRHNFEATEIIHFVETDFVEKKLSKILLNINKVAEKFRKNLSTKMLIVAKIKTD